MINKKEGGEPDDPGSPPSFTCKRSSILGYSLHRTYRNAGSALDTLLRIDFRLAVDHRNSLNRTRSNTGLTSHTYILINNRLSHYKTSLKKDIISPDTSLRN
jgi:hypothetical protein